jgi:hypothetical protein
MLDFEDTRHRAKKAADASAREYLCRPYIPGFEGSIGEVKNY